MRIELVGIGNDPRPRRRAAVVRYRLALRRELRALGVEGICRKPPDPHVGHPPYGPLLSEYRGGRHRA
jgi:hypothetical protein